MGKLYAILPPICIVVLGAGLASITLSLGVAMALFGALDAVGRLRDYNYLKKFTYIPERLARYYGSSFCGRWIIILIDPAYGWYYYRVGYRWWHILPDGFPKVLFYRRFWITLYKGHRA
jgi:hypothetical protein